MATELTIELAPLLLLAIGLKRAWPRSRTRPQRGRSALA